MLAELKRIMYAEPTAQRVAGQQVTTGQVQTSTPVSGGRQPYSPRWLDLGLQMEGVGGFKVPTFSASDIVWDKGGLPEGYTGPVEYETTIDGHTDYSKPKSYWVEDPAIGGESGGYWRDVPKAGVRWADNANRDAYSWLSKAAPGSTSIDLVSDPNNPNGFSLKIKTADKQGTIIPYVLQGDEWVPQQHGIQQVQWDTNSGARDFLPALAVVTAPFWMSGLTSLLGAGGGAAGAAGGAAASSGAASGLPASLGGIEGVISGATASPDLMAGLGTGFAGTGPMTGTLPSIVPGALTGAGAAGLASSIGSAGAAGAGLAAGARAIGNALSSLLSPNVLNIGANLLSGYLQDRSARRAADAQMAATQAAIDESRRQFDITRADMEPWRRAGTDAINQLRTAIAPGAEFNRNYTWADIEGDPIFARTFQAGLEEGTNALRRQLSAAGQRNSGAALKALTRFASDYANKTATDALNRWRAGIGDRFNRLSGVAGTGQQTVGQLGQLGQNYANNYGNLVTSAGNARGASEIARGNAWGSALTNAFNNWQQNRLIDRLLSIG